MPNRDAMWVLPNGTTTVISVDENDEPVEPIPGTEPVVVTAEPAPAPKPAPPPVQHVSRKRRRRR